MRTAGLALILLTLQEGPSPETLVRDLDSDDIARREQAMTRLTALGDTAVPVLQQAAETAGPDGRLRAKQILERIDRQNRIRRVFSEPAPLDLRCQNKPLRDVLQAVSNQSGLSVSLKAEFGRNIVSITKPAMTMQEALDLFCLQAGDCEWSYVSPRLVEMHEGAARSGPVCYASRFRFSLPQLESFRSRRGDQITSLLCLRVQVDHEAVVRLGVPPVLVVEQVVDSQGREIAARGELSDQLNAFTSDEEENLDPERSFRSSATVFTGPQSQSQTLSRISGHALYHFSLRDVTLEVEDVEHGAWARRGDLEIGVFGPQAEIVLIRVQSRDGKAVSPGTLNVAGTRIVDREGVDHDVPLHAVQVRELAFEGAAALYYVITFDASGQSQAESVRLKVVTDGYEKKVPFSFADVPLP